MKENEVVANVLVCHPERGVGRITAIEADGQSLLIRFGNQSQHRMSREVALRSLDRLPDDGLEATLWNNPETTYGWIRNGPLRLVAAAVADAGGAAKPKELQTRLQQRVLRDVKWTTWWKRIQPLVKQSPYFQVRNGSYTLIGNAGNVPEETYSSPLRRVTVGGQRAQKRKLASPKEWIEWLLGARDIFPPGNVPAQVVLDILNVLPAGMLEGASQRLLSGLRFLLEAKRAPPTQALVIWVKAITRLTGRWSESSLSDSMQTLPRNIVEFAAELLSHSRHRVFAREFPAVLIPIVQKGDGAAQEVVRGLIASLQARPTVAVELLQTLTAVLSDTARGLFLKEVVREVFQVGAPEHQHLVLQAINERDRDYLLEYLCLLVVDEQIPADKVVETLCREWLPTQETKRHVSLKSLLVAGMLLGDVVKALHSLMTDGFRSAIREQGDTIADHVVSMLAGIAREEISKTRYELEERLRHEVEAVNKQLLGKQGEIERAHRTIIDLQQEIKRRREEAQLDIRRDMLLAIGEVLQILSKKDERSADLIADAEAGLSLALKAGGAEVLGLVGQAVSYDPRLHQSDKTLREGVSAVVTAPGVRIGTGHLGDLVLLKARVVEKGQGDR
jgi:phage gp37-like protein